MRKGLVDSMILIDYDKGDENAVEWWERMVEDGWSLSISVVTVMELLKGIASIPGERREALSNFEERIDKMRKDSKIRRIYPITTKIGRRARQFLRDYCVRHTPPSSGRKIEGLICDMLNAATAIEHGLVLFTHNRRDFEWIDCLEVREPDYYVSQGD